MDAGMEVVIGKCAGKSQEGFGDAGALPEC